MSKPERQSVVKFRRKYAIKGNSIKIVKLPVAASYHYASCETEAMSKAVTSEELYVVLDGSESGVLIQLADVHDLTWLPADCVERIT